MTHSLHPGSPHNTRIHHHLSKSAAAMEQLHARTLQGAREHRDQAEADAAAQHAAMLSTDGTPIPQPGGSQ